MAHNPKKILEILDGCCSAFTFPMLDNGYVYLAATRLSAYYSENNWALVIEVFGYSPRSGFPDIHVHTFASKLWERDSPEKYINEVAYRRYLENNPNNESRFFFPIEGEYHDLECDEFVSRTATHILLRGQEIKIPSQADFTAYSIELEDQSHLCVFELCRYLAEAHRDLVLGSSEERTVSVLPEMNQILQLEEWRHPDTLNDELPSSSLTFQQIAQVLSNGDVSQYRPTEQPNTHWSNWPEGGRL